MNIGQQPVRQSPVRQQSAQQWPAQQWPAQQRKVRVIMLSTIALVITIATLALSNLEAHAQGLQTTQFTEKAAVLVGPKADSPVPLYLRPAANQPNVGYGINGSAVTVLEQVASFLPEANQDSAWTHVRLNEPPYTEGWIQGKFLSIKEDDIKEDSAIGQD